MDLSKLNGNEKLAVYGAIAAIVAPILASFGTLYGIGAGFGWFGLILALAMLAIVFMPQFSPQTKLPGSKGSLMLVVGGIAGVAAALQLLGSIGVLAIFGSRILFVIGWLLGVAGGLLMGWAGWQEFQAEGGKFVLGTASGDSPASSSAPPPAAPPPATPPASPAPMSAPPAATDTDAHDEQSGQSG